MSETRKEPAMRDIVEQLESLAEYSNLYGFHGRAETYTEAAAEITRLRAELAEARDIAINEREDNLWNAYAAGSEAAGIWTHLSMSDGEDLVRQCGLDVKARYYDAAIIKAKIPGLAAAMFDMSPKPQEATMNEGVGG